MEVGHSATERFLIDVEQNQGRLITIPGNARSTIAAQELPPEPSFAICCNCACCRAAACS